MKKLTLFISFILTFAIMTLGLANNFSFTTKNTMIFIGSIILEVVSLILIIYLIRKVKYTCSYR